MENYHGTKAHIFMNQNPEILLSSMMMYCSGYEKDAHSKVLSISQHHKVDSGAYFEGNTCYAVLDGGKATPVIDTRTYPH